MSNSNQVISIFHILLIWSIYGVSYIHLALMFLALFISLGPALELMSDSNQVISNEGLN